MRDLVKALSLGMTVCFSITIPIVIGVFADACLNTKPLWIVVGIITGIAGALYTLKELIEP